MAKAKVFIFAPADPTGESDRILEAAGCELKQGKANWDTPQGDSELEMAQMSEGADALVGTSIRSTPITQKIMQSSKSLRIVAKYTIGVDDVDVDAATELGILVTHSPTEPHWGGAANAAAATDWALLAPPPPTGSSGGAVAEGAITNMRALAKKLRERQHVGD